MALSYGFFDAELTPSGQYDRVYAAEQFAEYFHLIVSNGVFPDPATQFQVVASDTPNMNVNVSDGYGWINGYYAKNSGPYPLAIQAASGTLNRIDAVVLRWVNASRSMELAVKTGIAASTPTVPALQRDTDVYELMLATVTVAAGATSIPQSSITDKRSDTAVCGWVTGAVQNIDTTNLFAQYDTAFQEWFDNIKSQLSGDIATNLQNQIDRNAENIATINATTLKKDTKTALGLPTSAGPDDAFKVLANIGNLHVWERVQTYADPVPAGYTLGDEINGFLYVRKMGSANKYYEMTIQYGSNIGVSDDGTVYISDVTSYTNYPGSTDMQDLLKKMAGKYFKIVKFTYPDYFTSYVDELVYIPATATITLDSNINMQTDYQVVTGTPAIPAGTTTDYLTSTDRNAYPDQSAEGGQDAYYTFWDVVSNVSFGADGNTYIHYDVSDSVVVDKSGNVTLGNTTRVVIGYGYNYTTDTVKSALAGKFIEVYTNEYSGGSDTHTFIPNNTIVYIPSDVSITQDGLGPKHFIASYQPVTGHAAIPANTTITYLGQLGGGARIEVGSYVGTGTYGESNASSITFPFFPKIIAIHYFGNKSSSSTAGISLFAFGDALNSSYKASVLGFVHVTNSSSNYGGLYEAKSNVYAKLSGKTFSWYNQNNVTDQANVRGITYRYYAIG